MMVEQHPAFAEELQREPEPNTLARIADLSRRFGIVFALIVAGSLAACNLLCWGGF